MQRRHPLQEARELQAGAAAVDITPSLPTALEGYVTRSELGTHVLDPIQATALTLSDGINTFVMIGLDLAAVDMDFVQEVSRLVIKAHGRESPGKVTCLVWATHTHSGPAGAGSVLGDREPTGDLRVREHLLAGAVMAGHKALEAQRPAQLWLGSSKVIGVATNRHDPKSPIDPELITLDVRSTGGDSIAVLTNYGCHPTVLGAANVGLSADLVWGLRSALAEQQPARVVLFATGAAADVSTRFTRHEQTHQEAMRLGRLLARAAEQAISEASPLTVRRLAAGTVTVNLPTRMLPTADAARRELEDRQFLAIRHPSRSAAVAAEGALIQARLANRGLPPSLALSLYAVAVGDLGILTIPAEVFAETGLAIKAASPFRRTILISCAGGYVGYLPTEQAVAARQYEALVSPFDSVATGIVVGSCLTLLRAVLEASSEEGNGDV